MPVQLTAHAVRQQAARLGFTQVGIIPASPSPRLDAYYQWIEAGMHGAMSYLARPDRQIRRADLNVILPGVRSLIIVAQDYAPPPLPESALSDPCRGRISSYAWWHGLPRSDDAAPGTTRRLACRPIRRRRRQPRLCRHGRDPGAQPRPTGRIRLRRQEHHADSSSARIVSSSWGNCSPHWPLTPMTPPTAKRCAARAHAARLPARPRPSRVLMCWMRAAA